MSRNQRLGFLAVAVTIAVVAVVVVALAGTGGGDENVAGTTTPTPAATGTASPQEASPGSATPTATPAPTVPTLTAAKVRDLDAKQGDTVRFSVTNPSPEEVHVHGYDLMEDVGPGKPATFSFNADITGIFEIELERSGTQLARLKVEP